MDELFVNSTHGDRVDVHFDVKFPHIACSMLSVDAVDSNGLPQRHVSQQHVHMRKMIDGKVRPPSPRSLKSPPLTLASPRCAPSGNRPKCRSGTPSSTSTS